MRRTLAAFVVVLAALLMTSPAHAMRPTQSAPSNCSCKTFLHGGEARALRESKARQRARGKWELKAIGAAGVRYRDWANAKVRHYDCRKKGRWHYCRAAAYPCREVCEVSPSQ